jgi:probable F420-dependent oxidoreductase
LADGFAAAIRKWQPRLDGGPVVTGRPFRFGVVAAQARSGEDWAEKVRRIESMGYAIVLMPDVLNYSLAPLPALAAAAIATRSLRVGTYVLANDLRNPVLLAKEAATVDLLSGGRFELGLGVGRPGAAEDNRMLGIPFDAGALRVARLAESLALLKALLSGDMATASGPHYAAANAKISPLPMQQPRPPILVAASKRRLLELAAREADIIALGVAPTEPEAGVAERIDWIRAAARERFDQLELNLNLMAVGQQVPRWIASQMGLRAESLARSGAISALTGTTDEMVETLQRRRERLGISYIVVGDELMEGLAPVVERTAGR